jgi:hypothetical protein
LPERRKCSEKITQNSILKWGEKIFGKDVDTEDIFLFKLREIRETSGVFRLLHPLQLKIRRQIHVI